MTKRDKYNKVMAHLRAKGKVIDEHTPSCIKFFHEGARIIFWVEKEWSTGASIDDGRGIPHLFAQIEPVPKRYTGPKCTNEILADMLDRTKTRYSCLCLQGYLRNNHNEYQQLLFIKSPKSGKFIAVDWERCKYYCVTDRITNVISALSEVDRMRYYNAVKFPLSSLELKYTMSYVLKDLDGHYLWKEEEIITMDGELLSEINTDEQDEIHSNDAQPWQGKIAL